jgi:hypothetical protein
MDDEPDPERWATVTTVAGMAGVAVALLVAGFLLQLRGGTYALVGGWTLVGCGGGSLVAALLLAVATWW